MMLAPALPAIVWPKALPVRLIARDPGVVRRGEELHFGTRSERVADGRQDTIGRSAAGRFAHGVGDIVDKVHVVAAEALHRIDAAAAIDDVGAGIAGDRLAEGVARQVDRRDPGRCRSC